MSSKPVANILTGRDHALQALYQRAQYLQQLTQALRESLDAPLAEHITVANLREHTAVITTDTPAWLTQLRYQAPVILALLKALPGLQGLRKVHFKIQPASEPPPTPPARNAHLSRASAQLLKSTAVGMEDDALAEALYRLSRHAPTDTS